LLRIAMTLIEAIRDLDSFGDEATIYAAEPWNESSTVIVALEPAAGGPPTQAAEHGLRYFLEVSIARDFLEGWIGSLGAEPTLEEKCARLIKYAITDA
jgi:hypothetical protein